MPSAVAWRTNLTNRPRIGLRCRMSNEQELLEKAIRIAVEAHAGQKDRYGVPYILHPNRVMQRLGTTEERTVGILHDVVEDTDWTLKRLREEGFPESIVAAIDAVSKREGEDYEAFVRRSAANPLARRVKLADLEDNMDLRRLPEISEKDLPRLQKYLRAWKLLTRPG